jgi:hypothetical protein
MSDETHFQDLNEIQDALADVEQLLEWGLKAREKLRRVHADIRTRIGKIDVQITR